MEPALALLLAVDAAAATLAAAAAVTGVNPLLGLATAYTTASRRVWRRSHAVLAASAALHAAATLLAFLVAGFEAAYTVYFLGIPLVPLPALEYARARSGLEALACPLGEAEPVYRPGPVAAAALHCLAALSALVAAYAWLAEGPLLGAPVAAAAGLALVATAYSLARPEAYHAVFVDRLLADRLVLAAPLALHSSALGLGLGLLATPYAAAAGLAVSTALLAYAFESAARMRTGKR